MRFYLLNRLDLHLLELMFLVNLIFILFLIVIRLHFLVLVLSNYLLKFLFFSDASMCIYVYLCLCRGCVVYGICRFPTHHYTHCGPLVSPPLAHSRTLKYVRTFIVIFIFIFISSYFHSHFLSSYFICYHNHFYFYSRIQWLIFIFICIPFFASLITFLVSIFHPSCHPVFVRHSQYYLF